MARAGYNVSLATLVVLSVACAADEPPQAPREPGRAHDGDDSDDSDDPAHGGGLSLWVGRPLIIDGAFVSGGYFKSEAALAANARLKALKVSFGGMTQTVTLPDPTIPGPLPPDYGGWFAATVSSPATIGADWPTSPVSTIEFEIVAAHPGGKYEDLCISEIDLLVIDPEALD
jgi:hypothetical protein